MLYIYNTFIRNKERNKKMQGYKKLDLRYMDNYSSRVRFMSRCQMDSRLKVSDEEENKVLNLRWLYISDLNQETILDIALVKRISNDKKHITVEIDMIDTEFPMDVKFDWDNLSKSYKNNRVMLVLKTSEDKGLII